MPQYAVNPIKVKKSPTTKVSTSLITKFKKIEDDHKTKRDNSEI